MGEAAALLSAFCWACTSVVLARLGAKYGGSVHSGLRFLIASPFAIALLFLADDAHEVAAATSGAILAVIASAVVNYLIGDTVYIRALPRVGLQRMSPAVVSGQVSRLPDTTGPARLGPLPTLGLMLLVAGSWATSTMLIAGGRDDLGPIAVNALRIPAGGLLVATVAMITSRGEVLRRLPQGRDILLVLAVGVFGTALGSLCYVYAVAEAGAARAVILNATSPLMVVPLSMWFLRERLTPRIALGTAFCLSGTLIVVATG